MKYKLMIKTHNYTKLKYLCITHREDYDVYEGSGYYWKKHLSKHGKDISTEVIFETDDIDELRNIGLQYSAKFDVVESDEWANLIPESGYHVSDPDRQRSGWLGWYSSLTEEEKCKRNENISKNVSARLEIIKEDLSKILSERRKSLSSAKKLARKHKIQASYATGKHDHLFKRYSIERMGSGNPAAKQIEINGILYGSVQEASRQTGLPAHKLYKIRKQQVDKNKDKP